MNNGNEEQDTNIQQHQVNTFNQQSTTNYEIQTDIIVANNINDQRETNNIIQEVVNPIILMEIVVDDSFEEKKIKII